MKTIAACLHIALLGFALPVASAADSDTAPLVVGQTFVIQSEVLGEERRINVFKPTYYGKPFTEPMPVIYMPDGGIHEDFMHIAGLLDVSVVNGTVRPFLLVGIENTDRGRDMTGPTSNPEDRKALPQAGGSQDFRDFIRKELKPAIASRFEVTDESVVIGESLAGLFVVESFLKEPQLFDIYIAVDPSLWWNSEELVAVASNSLDNTNVVGKSLFLAASDTETIAEPVAELAETLRDVQPEGLEWHYQSFPNEQHGTIYHPAALQAFRLLLKKTDETAH